MGMSPCVGGGVPVCFPCGRKGKAGGGRRTWERLCPATVRWRRRRLRLGTIVWGHGRKKRKDTPLRTPGVIPKGTFHVLYPFHSFAFDCLLLYFFLLLLVLIGVVVGWGGVLVSAGGCSSQFVGPRHRGGRWGAATEQQQSTRAAGGERVETEPCRGVDPPFSWGRGGGPRRTPRLHQSSGTRNAPWKGEGGGEEQQRFREAKDAWHVAGLDLDVAPELQPIRPTPALVRHRHVQRSLCPVQEEWGRRGRSFGPTILFRLLIGDRRMPFSVVCRHGEEETTAEGFPVRRTRACHGPLGPRI